MFKKLFEKLNKKDDSNNSTNIEITTNSALESQRRSYLNVPYNEKETAKKYGAKWHPGRKQWYIQGDINIDDDNIVKWIDFEEKYNLYATSFYLAASKRYCWKCSKLTPVYAVLYDNYEYLSFDSDYERIEEKEMFVNEWLRDNEPFFAPLSDLTSSTIDQMASISHPIVETCMSITKRKNAQQYCFHCNAKQGNYYLFDEIDSPFGFMDPKILNYIKLYKLNIPVKSLSDPSYTTLGNKKSFVQNATVETII